MQQTLYTARWILPVTSEPIADGGVLVNATGTIDWVGRAADIDTVSAQRIDFGNALLLPGLINVHAHPELGAFRGLLDDLPFHLWIPELMRCKREAALTDEDYATAALWTCVESLRNGITTMGATETSGAAAGALHQAGMRGVVYVEAFGPAPAQVDESIADVVQRIARIGPSASDRVRVGVSPHAPYTVSDALFRAVADLARAEAMPVAVHAAEAEAETLLVRDGAGPFAAALRARGIATSPRARSTIDLLNRTGVLDTAPLLIHCVQIDDADLAMIADSGATIAHCPIANARLGHGIAPIVEATAAHVRFAIGTDSVASNNRIDMLEEARAAQVLQRARARATGVLPSDELLRLVTIEAARALGFDHRIGSLEPGKDADLCAISLDGPNTTPTGSAMDALFHSARGSDVMFAAVQGRALYADGQILAIDEGELKTRIDRVASRLADIRRSGHRT